MSQARTSIRTEAWEASCCRGHIGRVAPCRRPLGGDGVDAQAENAHYGTTVPCMSPQGRSFAWTFSSSNLKCNMGRLRAGVHVPRRCLAARLMRGQGPLPRVDEMPLPRAGGRLLYGADASLLALPVKTPCPSTTRGQRAHRDPHPPKASNPAHVRLRGRRTGRRGRMPPVGIATSSCWACCARWG